MIAEPMDRDIIDMDGATHMERMLIGALLIDRDALPGVAEWLKPGAFLNQTCRNAYAAMLACFADGVPVDVATVAHGYEKTGHDFHEIPFGDLAGMIADCPCCVHAPYYAREVADYARRRAVLNLGQSLAAGAYRGDFDYDAAYRAAMEEIEQLMPDDTNTGPRTYAEVMPDFRDRMLRTWDGQIPRVESDIGFRALRKPLRGGLRPGELCIIAGRSGMGKTAFGLQVLHNIARNHPESHVLIFSNEMSIDALVERAISEVAGVAGELVDTGNTYDEVRNRILNATMTLESLPVAIDDMAGITTSQMLMRIQRFQRRHHVRAVLFDYVELAGDRGDGEVERVSSIVKALKNIALATKTTVIALSQLSRNVENRSNKTPQLSDLRYGGEAAADQVMLLYRPEYYDPADNPGVCEVILAKQRNGMTGVFPLRFEKELMTFKDMIGGVE